MSKTGYYQGQTQIFSKKLQTVKKRHGVVSIFRLLTFAGFAATLFWVFPVNHLLGIGIGILFFSMFLAFIKWHKRLEDNRDFLQHLIQINEKEAKGCMGDISGFQGGNEFTDSNHPYSYDIDLFGDGSLFQFLNRTVTKGGKDLLARWLMNNPLTEKEIRQHQEAVRELAPSIEFRQHFAALGMIYRKESNPFLESFSENWNQAPFFKTKKRVTLFLYLWPILTLLVIVGASVGFVPWSLFSFLFLINLAIIGFRVKEFNRHYQQLSEKHQHLKLLLHLVGLIEKHKPASEYTQVLYKKLFVDGKPVSRQIKELTQLIDALDNRNNFVFGVILNGLLLWDWQYLLRIERWSESHQLEFEKWEQSVSGYDALMSLANLLYNHPEFAFAEISSKDFEFTAQQLGHPLLKSGNRIDNDFKLDEHQRYAIVTGANMAGKSTFLRTVATNLVLAGCGAPVCATKLVFKPLPLFTSMRNEDSLQKNESYFFAELKRLQRITLELDKGEKLFIILDEILRGTNSEDKRKGSIGFVKKIIQQRAFGLVATHDLELARLAEQFPDVFKALCFEVTMESNELQFNYKLQPGVTKNMNASFLMKQMGIIE